MMSEWVYHDAPFNETLIPENALGFIYKITCLENGKAYLGKKLLFFKKTSVKTLKRKNGAKYKKKTKTLVQSDWPTYWSSSEKLVQLVKELGEDKFTREILFFCSTKGGMSYWEAKEQMLSEVLENQDKYFNGIINCRINHRHITPKI